MAEVATPKRSPPPVAGAPRREAPKQLRTDIQALRGAAVLLVLLYHAKLGVRGGYLGVDVFFVISGYLMTVLIATGIDQGDFTFAGFYFRRAKRLLPAAYATFFATAIAAPVFLTWSSLVAFSKQMIGAVTFTANIVLWRQSGYFDGAADLKPFLHVWSLSLEEQYYFILPALLVFVPRRLWVKTAIGLLVASGLACAVATVRAPSLAFYWLPFRAWELGLGSLGALLVRWDADRVRALSRRLAWPAVAAVLAIPIWPLSQLHPGPDAMIVCLATFAIVACDRPELWRNPAARALAFVGDFSYSLYLVHWPILAFALNAWVAVDVDFPFAIRCGALLLALVLGYLSYRYVETPVRRSRIRPSGRLMAGLATSSALLIAIPVVTARRLNDHVDYEAIRDWNFGFGVACNFDDAFRPGPPCQTGPSPTLLVWGDSFAMMLIEGIDVSRHGDDVVQATKSSCGPLLSLAEIETQAGTQYNRAWAEQCLRFNHSVVDYVRANRSIETVVLSSVVRQYLEPKYVLIDDDGRSTPASAAVALEGLRRTVDTLRALGRRVVLVAPPPSAGFDAGLCLERLAQHKVRVGASPDCTVPVADYHRIRAPVLSLIDSAARRFDLPVFRFDPFLCDATRCVTQIGSTFLYRHEGHLSRTGSRLLGARLSLTDSLVRMAR